MNKKIYFLTIFIITIFICITPLSANEDNTGNFSEINNKISTSEEIHLDRDYSQEQKDSQICINKSVTIDGCGHEIITENSMEIFNLNSSSQKINLTIKNTTFKNVNNLFNKNTTDNITFIDCSFINNKNIVYPSSDNFEANKNKTGTISKIVKKVAKLIIGGSTDLKAAKKIANWVAKNIQHEVKAGLYQSAEVTLFRGKGNCITTTNLFLQMCAAVGLAKKHKLYYVQTGRMVYGQRHFFAIVDHVCVDVDVKKSRPWANCPTNRNPTCITKYPYLPVLVSY